MQYVCVGTEQKCLKVQIIISALVQHENPIITGITVFFTFIVCALTFDQ